MSVCAFTANRDPEAFAGPDDFDITVERDKARTLTFGAGIHFCVGRNLARAEIAEALRFLAERIESLEPAGEAELQNVSGIYGVETLPVEFTAGLTGRPLTGYRERIAENVTKCPGCGLLLPVEDGPVHAYIGSSPACWRRFGEVLAREFQDEKWFRPHQITTDAYAVQHPGLPERRSIQSVALHLMTLGMVLERRLDPALAPRLHRQMAARPAFTWLEPPSMEGRMNVVDVLAARDPETHQRLIRQWAADVWEAWSPHHETIWKWVDLSLGGRTGGLRD